MSDAKRLSRLVARLPRMLTEADDYAWVPMGDVLVAIADIDAAELAWPEEGERIVMTTLRDAVNHLPDYLAAVEALAGLHEWIEPYVDGYHSSCDLDRGYDYAECSCGLDDRLAAVRTALARLRESVPA